jgi:ankyrin repeat protein
VLAELGLETDGFLAAELGDLERVRTAIADDATFVTGRTVGGATALHGAAYFGQAAAVELLLASGADADATTYDDFLQIPVLGSAIAATPGLPQPSDDEAVVLELVRMLLEAGAGVDRPRRDGMTARHAASWRGLARVAQELFDAGSQGHLRLAVSIDTGGPTANPYA